jgi:hypothetical protein
MFDLLAYLPILLSILGVVVAIAVIRLLIKLM